jgi:DNA-binding Lrp family transcriptional regulator
MNLTKNEKKVLKLLLENSRLPDSDIAAKLSISSQAVGKIRKKLEENVIGSYTLNLNYSKLGIEAFAIAIAKLTKEGMDKGELEVETLLHKCPHVINAYRLPKGSRTHIIVYGFMDLNELDNFFHSPKAMQDLHTYLETQEFFTFSHNSLIKNNPVALLQKAIDCLGTTSNEVRFLEFENFKRKLK